MTLTAVQAGIIRQALDDAERYLRKRASDWCDDCATAPAQACEDHSAALDGDRSLGRDVTQMQSGYPSAR